MTARHPIRVLHVVATLGRGGAETMIMNHYRHIDRRQIQFDFLVNYPHRGEYEDEVEALGGHVYRTMPIRPWGYPAYFRCLDRFFSLHQGEYTAVHSHIQDNSGFVLRAAARHGVPCRIAHSHLASIPKDLKYPFYLYGRHYVKRYVTHRMACGEGAADCMFGPSADVKIFRNAIDTKAFSYSPAQRACKRAELGIADTTLVIGHVGRFYPQKNHPYLLRIFAALHTLRPDSLLLLVGTGGSGYDAAIHLASKLGIAESVRFLGSRSDVPQLMQAMDAVIFPSLYEGLPVSIIEAQAAGLPCIISDTIDADTAVTELVRFMSLNQPPHEWAEAAISTASSTHRADQRRQIAHAGYDVEANTRWLSHFYLSHQPNA